MVLGAAEMLAKDGNLPAPVRLVFQPAEERGLGALAMIDAGALEGVEMIFGGHVDRHYPTGQIVAHAGAVNASTDSFRIDIQRAATRRGPTRASTPSSSEVFWSR
jgi:hippurate hydrolase